MEDSDSLDETWHQGVRLHWRHHFFFFFWLNVNVLDYFPLVELTNLQSCASFKVMSLRTCVNGRQGINGSLLSATCVSINRPAEQQRGAKFCPVPDLWPRGAFFLTRSNWIYPEHLCYSHLLGPARCPTKNEPRLSASTCTELHLLAPAGRLYWALVPFTASLSPSEGLSADRSGATCEDADLHCGLTATICPRHRRHLAACGRLGLC